MQRRRSEHLQAENTPWSSGDSNGNDGKQLRVPSRSPHPYHRRRVDEPQTLFPGSSPGALDNDASPAPSESEKDVESSEGERRRKREQTIMSPSESGTEADDEGYGFVKALPAPPLRPRKGLRDTRGSGLDGQLTPILTPTTIEEDARRLSQDSSMSRKADKGRDVTEGEIRTARAKFVKRRRAELLRRASEVGLLIVIGLSATKQSQVWGAAGQWHRGETTTLKIRHKKTHVMFSRAHRSFSDCWWAIFALPRAANCICLETNSP
jgi:hypothetical protein